MTPRDIDISHQFFFPLYIHWLIYIDWKYGNLVENKQPLWHQSTHKKEDS